MSRRIAAIVNPVSGRTNTIPIVRQLATTVEAAGARFDWTATLEPGHATKLASALGPDVDALLIAGGDGTLNEVINGLDGRDLPCALLPTGTENLVARALGLSREIGAVARTLLGGKPRPFDVGIINGRRFLAVAGVGFDAECVLRMEEIRSGNINLLHYLGPIWRTFCTHRFPILHVEADGSPVFEGRGLVLIGNVRRYGGGFLIHANARHDDGLLDVCAFPCSTRWELIKHAMRVVRRWHIGRAGVVYRQCQHMKITSPDTVAVEVDGEFAGTLPLESRVLPNGIQFLQLPDGR
ncbi:MAG: diacylglycerol kinase family lipid kinase [Phycisphaerae bacterium]|jgi:diacylglycerol kinase (ATP)